MTNISNFQPVEHSSDVFSTGLAVPMDDRVAEHLANNPGGLDFSIDGKNYNLKLDKETGNYQLFDENDNLLDGDVQLNSALAPDGTIELGGISEPGTRVYLAEAKGGGVVAFTADHGMGNAEIESIISFSLESAPSDTYFIDQNGIVTDTNNQVVGITKDYPAGQYLIQGQEKYIIINGEKVPFTRDSLEMVNSQNLSTPVNSTTAFSFETAPDGTYIVDDNGSVTNFLTDMFVGRVDPEVHPAGEYFVQNGQVSKQNIDGTVTSVASTQFDLNTAPDGNYFVDENGEVTNVDGKVLGYSQDLPQGQYVAELHNTHVVIDGKLEPIESANAANASTVTSATKFSFDDAPDGTYYVDDFGRVTNFDGVFVGKVDPQVYSSDEYFVGDGQTFEINMDGKAVSFSDDPFVLDEAPNGTYFVGPQGRVTDIDGNVVGFSSDLPIGQYMVDLHNTHVVIDGKPHPVGSANGSNASPVTSTTEFSFDDATDGTYKVDDEGRVTIPMGTVSGGIFVGRVDPEVYPSGEYIVKDSQVSIDIDGKLVPFTSEKFVLDGAPNGNYFVDQNGQVTDVNGNIVGINNDLPPGQYVVNGNEFNTVLDGQLVPVNLNISDLIDNLGARPSSVTSETPFQITEAPNGTYTIDLNGNVTDSLGIFVGKIDPEEFSAGEYIVQDGQVGVDIDGELVSYETNTSTVRTPDGVILPANK
jgi:hypothetical protein